MTAMTAATLDLLSTAGSGSGSASPVRRCPRAGTASGSTSRSDAPASTSRSSGWRCARAGAYEGEHFVLPLPDGPGKALRLMLHPPRADYRSTWPSIGPRTSSWPARSPTAGWGSSSRQSTPPSRSTRCGPVRERAGRPSTTSTSPRPFRLWSGRRARPAPTPIRGYTALYVGGMGSREAELLQRARPPDGVRGGCLPRPGPRTWTGAPRGAGGRAARTGRPDVADRAAGADHRPDRRLRRGRGQHAGDHAVGDTFDQRAATLRTVAELVGASGVGGVRRWTRSQALTLGLLQGLTEFLPSRRRRTCGSSASCSAGRTRARRSRRSCRSALSSRCCCSSGTTSGGSVGLAGSLFKPELRGRRDALLGWYIILGTIPVVVVGVAAQRRDRERVPQPLADRQPSWSARHRPRCRRAGRPDGPAHRDAGLALGRVLLGLAQALSVVPGVSRSGATISMGLFLGYEREAATRFAFLLAIPAVVGRGPVRAPRRGTGDNLYTVPETGRRDGRGVLRRLRVDRLAAALRGHQVVRAVRGLPHRAGQPRAPAARQRHPQP